MLRRSAPRRGHPALPSRSGSDGATSDVVSKASGIRREDLALERHALHLHRWANSAQKEALWATFAQKKARRATLARKRAYDLPPLPGRPGGGDVAASVRGRPADGLPPPAEARSKRPPAKALTERPSQGAPVPRDSTTLARRKAYWHALSRRPGGGGEEGNAVGEASTEWWG